ncbi:copper transport protein CTR2 [Rhizoctonia solani]|uniref:Copper transport protein n=1 Tax=Rhizoctonia solani TaxID=456999 RepID=A0A8H8NYL2_9AGAM|nr:copper transport protein CTR2 [Rhizoctonia solani]QRW21273.1 copper transport protein CTR2 [Rhizoctonia solani]
MLTSRYASHFFYRPRRPYWPGHCHPAPVEERRLYCYNSCMQSCSPPGSGTSSIVCYIKLMNETLSYTHSRIFRNPRQFLYGFLQAIIVWGVSDNQKRRALPRDSIQPFPQQPSHSWAQTAHRWQILELYALWIIRCTIWKWTTGDMVAMVDTETWIWAPSVMNMLWNTQIIDTCIVFKTHFVQWNILHLVCGDCSSGCGGKTSAIRAESPAEDEPLNPRVFKQPMVATLSPGARISRAALYGAQVFLSFFLMLVFMTYNAYLILAVVLGAAIGHYVFGAQMDAEAVLSNAGVGAKGMACH